MINAMEPEVKREQKKRPVRPATATGKSEKMCKVSLEAFPKSPLARLAEEQAKSFQKNAKNAEEMAESRKNK